MPTVNLAAKYDKKIKQQFTIASLIQGRLENNVDFVGVRTVRIYTINTVPLNDYNRTASADRYGVPEEVGDSLQELTMRKDKGFSGIIDKGNNLDQTINKAGKFLKVQLDEVIIPYKDRDTFLELAGNGGVIVGSATALSAANIIARMSAARAAMLNNRVPLAGRTWFVTTGVFNALIDTDQFKNINKVGIQTVVKGQVGELFGAPVVEVPADLMPAGVNFILIHKSAATSPAKIHDTKVHTDPPGISGVRVEGRFYWDTFVFGAKAAGIYVDVTTGGAVSVLAPVAINATTGAITGVTSGAAAFYTLDGSDPRYSLSAVSGTAPAIASGVRIRACQKNAGNASVYNSGVSEVRIA